MTGERRRRSVLSLVYDRANGLTLAGLVCGVLAISFIARGAYAAAMTALLWALFCDWFDGPLARRSRGRTDEDRAFDALENDSADDDRRRLGLGQHSSSFVDGRRPWQMGCSAGGLVHV